MTRCPCCDQAVVLPTITRRGRCGVEHTWGVEEAWASQGRFVPKRDGRSVTYLDDMSLRSARLQIEYDAREHGRLGECR